MLAKIRIVLSADHLQPSFHRFNDLKILMVSV